MTCVVHICEEHVDRDPVDSWLERAGYALHVLPKSASPAFLAQAAADVFIVESLETCQRLKADPVTAEVPVLQLLAADTAGLTQLPAADACLARPVQHSALLSMVQLLLKARRVEQTHERATRQWESTFNALRDAVLVLDGERRVVDVNRSMHALFAEDARGPGERPLKDLLWHRVRALVDEAPNAVSTSQEAHWEAEIALMGRNYRVMTDRVPEPSEHALTVMTLSDVTEQKRLESGYRKTTRELDDVARRQDEFLAMLAHELRNPLNAIVAANQLQSESHTPVPEAESARLHSLVERQSRHLARLIDELLDTSRVTRGELTLRLEPADLRQIAKRAAETQRSVLEGRRQKLIWRLPESPVHVACDGLRLEQAIANLLANASKYSSANTEIMLSVELDDEDHAVLSVRDQGMGIPPDMLTAIFELFVQVDQSLDRRRGGLGLGLTVARQLVVRHGGTLRAESAGLGHGARFVVTLPRCTPVPGEAPLLPEALPSADAENDVVTSVTTRPQPLKVLVIEDNDDSRELMCALLASHGYHVASAADGHAGLELAASDKPDVALVDIGLPGMNGYAIARELRAREAHEGETARFLIALTGYGSPADQERTRAAGFDVHLVKPVDSGRLFALLARVGAARGGERTERAGMSQ